MKNFLRSLQKKPILYATIQILLSSVLSLVVMGMLFPDLILRHRYSFIRYGDAEISFYGAFTILSNFLHGGIQLWDNYDQMPLAFYYLNGGLTSFNNIFTAAVYLVFAPLLQSPAEAFHAIYSVSYYSASILVRSAGYYLLLRRFTKSMPILVFSVVFGNTFMAPQTYLGFNAGNLYSFFPLLTHFIVRFFEAPKVSALLLVILTLVVCIANYPLIALGYFYLGAHFVIVAAAVWFLVRHRYALRHVFSRIRIKPTRETVGKALGVLLVSVVMLSPFVYLLKSTYRDYEFAHESSRFANMNILNVSTYFTRDSSYAPPKEFLYRMLNFEDNAWEGSWLFLGIAALFLAVCGVVVSRDSRKYIFAGAALLFWLINSPRQMTSFQSVAHWIVALTDPLNFTLRSFHMTGGLMLPFVLTPLVTLGLQSLRDVHAETEKTRYGKLCLVGVAMGGAFINVYPQVSSGVKLYLLVGYAAISIALIYAWIKNLAPTPRLLLIGSAIGVLVLFDGYAMRQYLNSFLPKVIVRPHSLPTTKEPLFLDYQNPYILPARQYYNGDRTVSIAGYANFGIYNIQGLYYRYTDLRKYFGWASIYLPRIYLPRHISYARLTGDAALEQYVQKDSRIIYEADSAVAEQDGLLAKLLERNLDRTIIMVDRDPGGEGTFTQVAPLGIQGNENNQPVVLKKLLFDLKESKPTRQNGLAYFAVRLPEEFPSYVSTGTFTNDMYLLKVMIGETELSPAQGRLIEPFTFDVQNVATGMLTIALPQGHALEDTSGVLYFPESQDPGITKIWKYEPDTIGFNYSADRDGWLVLHYPFDRRWVLTLDGFPREIYRVNYSFIGVPIQKGTHTVLLQYWPQTWVRTALGLSMVLIFVFPFVLTWIGIKDGSGGGAGGKTA